MILILLPPLFVISPFVIFYIKGGIIDVQFVQKI